MVGLGVLKVTRSGWALKSAKIAAMVGTVEQVAQELNDFTTQALEPTYEPATYRRVIGTDGLMPAPLTLRQEYDLIRARTPITILLGSRLLGLHDVPELVSRSEPHGRISAPFPTFPIS